MDSTSTATMEYYDLVKNWHKVKHKNVKQAIEANFTPYSVGYFGHPMNGTIEGLHKEQLELQKKFFQDNYDSREGERKPYWLFVKYGACHWVAPVALELAKLVEPNRAWRLLSGSNHTTVWDGDHTLFEFNYLCFDIPAQECFDAAVIDKKDIPVGERKDGSFTSPFFVPNDFEAKNVNQWLNDPENDWKALAAAARHYLDELGKTIRTGVIEDLDLSLAAAAQYELVQQFVAAIEKNQRRKAAKILESLCHIELSKVSKSIDRRAERVVTKLVKEVNQTGNVILFATPNDLENEQCRAGFSIRPDRIESITETESDDMLEEIGKWVRFSTVARWDLLMLVHNNITKETRSWKFDNFKAVAA